MTKPETVHVLTYQHKHGMDVVGVYRMHSAAVAAAYDLACSRVEENCWDDGELRDKFLAFENSEKALDYFHEVELGWSYSERLEISESPLKE